MRQSNTLDYEGAKIYVPNWLTCKPIGDIGVYLRLNHILSIMSQSHSRYPVTNL